MLHESSLGSPAGVVTVIVMASAEACMVPCVGTSVEGLARLAEWKFPEGAERTSTGLLGAASREMKEETLLLIMYSTSCSWK